MCCATMRLEMRGDNTNRVIEIPHAATAAAVKVGHREAFNTEKSTRKQTIHRFMILVTLFKYKV